VTIVFDTELGWGSIENGKLARRERAGVFARARSFVPELVDDMVRREIPATWALAGALIDPDAGERLGHLPPPRQTEIRAALSEARRASLTWPELLPRLRSASGMEIACHGFSHTRFDYPGLTSDAVAQEVALWRDATGGEAGPISMVCPRDTIAFVRTLSSRGVGVLRVPPGFAGPRSAVHRRLRWPSPARLVRFPETDSRLTGIEGSLFFRGGPSLSGRVRLLYSSIRARHAVARHDRTVLWLHPFNFGESPGLLPGFMQLLDVLAEERDRGHVVIRTLGSLPEAE